MSPEHFTATISGLTMATDLAAFTFIQWVLPDQQPLTPFQQFNYRKHQLQVRFFNAQDSLFTA